MVRDAERRAPGDRSVHLTLVSMYSNHSGNVYNVREAEREARIVERLDPSNSSVHYTMAMLYYNTNQRARAKSEMAACVARNPRGLKLSKTTLDLIHACLPEYRP